MVCAGPSPSRLAEPPSSRLEFLGRPFEEAKLFEIASAYEKIKRYRRPPAGFGPLSGEP
jgi:hypothetical protein